MNAVVQPIVNLGAWAWGLLGAVVVAVFGQDFAPYVLYDQDLILILCIVLPLMVCVAYLTLVGAQGDRLDAGAPRPEPRRPLGLLQPFADVSSC